MWVTNFAVEGINPTVDAAQTDAFPLFIEFNTATDNNFTQTPIVNNQPSTTPEPSLLLGFLGLGAGLVTSRKRK